MEGCRVYRVTDPPADWRARLRLAQGIVARCVEGSPIGTLTVSGRRLGDLEGLPTGLAVIDTMLWGYLASHGLPEARRRASTWLEGGATVYLACDRYDAQDRLLGGARAYCHPETGKSTLMLTVPAHDRAHADRLLGGMLRSVGTAGLSKDGADLEGMGPSLLAETKEAVRVGPLEVRPIRTGDYPHMFRLTREDIEPLSVLAAMADCVAGPLGAPDRVYLKLQAAAPALLDTEGLPFEEGPHWKVRAKLPGEDQIARLLTAERGIVWVTYDAVRWAGQPDAPLSEVAVGLSLNVLTLTVDLRVDGDAVEPSLREACPGLERSLDIPFD
jgi:hypothetical protein